MLSRMLDEEAFLRDVDWNQVGKNIERLPKFILTDYTVFHNGIAVDITDVDKYHELEVMGVIGLPQEFDSESIQIRKQGTRVAIELLQTID